MDLTANRHQALTASILAILIAGLAMAAFIGLKATSRVSYDEQTHHLPAIVQFSEQMPTPDLRDYPVATTPGYHLVMAAATRYLGVGEAGLRGINVGLSMGLFAALGWGLASRQPTGWGVLLGGGGLWAGAVDWAWGRGCCGGGFDLSGTCAGGAVDEGGGAGGGEFV